MRRYSGQSLVEYSFVISLVAISGIVGLMLLGGSLKGLLGKVSGLVDGSQNAGTVVQATATPTSSSAPAPAPSSAAKSPVAAAGPKMTVSFDPKTGTISMDGLEGASSGRITTSSQGTKAAAHALEFLAENATTDKGEPIDDNLSAKIKKLAALANGLADDMVSADRTKVADGVYLSLEDFKKQHSDIMPLLQDPRYANLLKQVNDYSGVVSSIAAINYLGQYPTNNLVGAGANVTFSGGTISGGSAYNGVASAADMSGSGPKKASGVYTLKEAQTHIVGTDITRTELTVDLDPIKMESATVTATERADGSVEALKGVGAENSKLSADEMGKLTKKTP